MYLKNGGVIMSAVVNNQEQSNEIPVVREMKDYSRERVFKEKVKKAKEFLQKHSLPKTFLNKGK